MNKPTAIAVGTILFDPRTQKCTEPGNSNPALIFRDILIRLNVNITKKDEQTLCKLADFCDEKQLELNIWIP